jgi:hypothetical protein
MTCALRRINRTPHVSRMTTEDMADLCISDMRR